MKKENKQSNKQRDERPNKQANKKNKINEQKINQRTDKLIDAQTNQRQRSRSWVTKKHKTKKKFKHFNCTIKQMSI